MGDSMKRYATTDESPMPEMKDTKVGVAPDVEECFSKDFKSVKKKFSDLLKKKMDGEGSGKISDITMALSELARIDKMEKTGHMY